MHKCYPATLVAALLIILVVPAIDSAAGTPNKAAPKNQTAQSVEFFSAIKAGKIDARVTVTPTFQLQAELVNQGDVPLNVELPQAFAAVPMRGLAIRGATRTDGSARPADPQSSAQGTSTPVLVSAINLMNMQTVGGGFWNRGPDGGPLMVALAPGKIQRVVVAVMCLEDGRKSPSVAMPYALVPIGCFAQCAEVGEVCKLLGHGMVNWRVAQLAAWHFNNHESWQALAAHRLRFSTAELKAAMRLADTATGLVKTHK
jgi:hypothetical protein